MAADKKPNPQLACYGLGALTAFSFMGDFERVRLVISQPRITTKPSEYDLTVAELEAWGYSTARSAVATCTVAAYQAAEFLNGTSSPDSFRATFLNPGEKQCKFCRAKATCPALRDAALETVLTRAPATPDEFADTSVPGPEHIKPTDAQWLSVCLDKADMIEDWLKGIRAEVERRLLAGQEVPSYKLVEGKQGNRAWSNPEEAETYLKDTVRVKTEDLYDMKLKSPTQIAKLGPQFDKEGKPKPVKEGQPAPIIGPRQWAKVAGLITRAPPAKHVAHISDPRPPVTATPVADDFEPVASDLA